MLQAATAKRRAAGQFADQTEHDETIEQTARGGHVMLVLRRRQRIISEQMIHDPLRRLLRDARFRRSNSSIAAIAARVIA